jgi:hypothetical protein
MMAMMMQHKQESHAASRASELLACQLCVTLLHCYTAGFIHYLVDDQSPQH